MMEKEETVKKIEYQTPILEEETELFVKQVWEEFNNGRWCFGCTNCNCN